MRITIEVYVSKKQKTAMVNIPTDLVLAQLVEAIYEGLKLEVDEEVGLYEEGGKQLDLLMNVEEANIVEGMKLYLL